MKELHLISKTKGKKKSGLKQSKRIEGKSKNGILMPEKLALANKLLGGVRLPDDPQAR